MTDATDTTKALMAQTPRRPSLMASQTPMHAEIEPKNRPDPASDSPVLAPKTDDGPAPDVQADPMPEPEIIHRDAQGERLLVINLGFPKSGTTTLAHALRAAGLNVADWRLPGPKRAGARFVGTELYRGYFQTGDPLSYMRHFDAFAQIDVMSQGLNLWPQTDYGLIKAIRDHHPGARFVLSYRDPMKQADSMRRWSNLGTVRLPEGSVPGLPATHGKTVEELARWIGGHYAFCRRIFAGDRDFLEYDMANGDAAERISEFLDISIPWWGVANANPGKNMDFTDGTFSGDSTLSGHGLDPDPDQDSAPGNGSGDTPPLAPR